MKVPEELITLIGQERRFFIATHINPEGDAIGSSLALSSALESMGKETVVYDRDPVPELYRFLPGAEKITHSYKSLAIGRLPVILLDCSEPGRAGLESVTIPFSAVIDHHETAGEFGDIKWIEPRAAATGMMVHHLLKALGAKMTRDIAINLYTSIATDTGTFRYDNTTSEVLRVCAELIDSGADPAFTAEALYETWSVKRFRLLMRVLNTFEMTGDIAMTHVTRGMFAETGTSAEDTEDFSNFTRMMKSVNISVFFRELEQDYWKVSLRSRGSTNVAKIAVLFNGGGHKNAAGYAIKASLDSAKRALIEAIAAKH